MCPSGNHFLFKLIFILKRPRIRKSLYNFKDFFFFFFLIPGLDFIKLPIYLSDPEKNYVPFNFN